VRSFTNLLAVLEQNPGADWRELIGGVEVVEEEDPDLAPLDDDEDAAPGEGDDDLATFRL
jgi:hypothetical protein